MIGIVDTGRSKGSLEALTSLKDGVDELWLRSIHGVNFGCPKAKVSLVSTPR